MTSRELELGSLPQQWLQKTVRGLFVAGSVHCLSVEKVSTASVILSSAQSWGFQATRASGADPTRNHMHKN